MGTHRHGAIPKLREVFANDFLIGAAVNPKTIVSSAELLADQYNSITAENEMKFESFHPEENRYTFEEADQLVAFARAHGMKMRGHTLVWHNQSSDWLFAGENGGLTNKETLFARLEAHIDTVIGRYKNDIYCWDVVNEAVADEGSELLRDSKWLQIAGDEFIPVAFELAHKADPKALLFYNDYNESNPVKREKIYTLVKSLLDRGTPIHGVGLQAHWNLFDPHLDEIRAAIERYATLGLTLQITEMDVSVFAFEDHRTDLSAPTETMLNVQARRYERFFDLFREYRDNISGVTFWGVDNGYTWLSGFPVRNRKNWPLLFDENHQPTESFWSVVK